MTGQAVQRLEAFAGSSISPGVHTPSSLPSLIAGLVLVLAGPACAGCTDPPAPGVEWRCCFQDQAEVAGADLSRVDEREVADAQLSQLKCNMAANMLKPDYRDS